MILARFLILIMIRLDPTSSAFINDPHFNPQYSTFCYTFQYMPGSTTYLDTPVVPVAAFATTGGFPVDCAIPDQRPLIKYVTGPGGFTGPAIASDLGSTSLRELRIYSEGKVDVPNHLFDPKGNPSEPINITRDYGFGDTQGTGSVFLSGTELTVSSWSNDVIVVTVPAGVATGQLVVTTNTGAVSPRGITVTTHLPASRIHDVSPSSLADATQIQDAIDAAADGDLIMMRPGFYNELVIMDKPVQLQGWGAGVTKLTAIRTPPSKLENWRTEIAARAGNSFDYLANQETGFLASEGPAIIVLGKSSGNFTEVLEPRIDGIEISGAMTGGGIFVNAYVDHLDISNNKITGNEGTYGGGIHVGNPDVTAEVDNNIVQVSSENDFINIHDNEVVLNGATFGPGGGIGLYAGTNDYTIDHNFICGNFAQDNGAGISHLGLSDNGVISNNTIAFNQNFNQGINVHGAGVFIGGQSVGLQLTEGSGDVVVEGNLIQGNSAATGYGGGIALSEINGIDVVNNPGNVLPIFPADPATWYNIDIFDNIIVNNHAGWSGAGIAMRDAASVRILNNTVAHNDATATVGNLFDPVTNASMAQVGAGIASFAHSTELAALTGQAFSNPDLQNNIVWENRTFSWAVDTNTVPATFGLTPGGFSDLGVIGGGALTPTHSILTDATGTDASNISADPEFVVSYFNGDRSQTVIQNEQTVVTNIQTAAALDEGGNFVDIHFGPLSLKGDYHVRTSSPVVNNGTDILIPELLDDIDGEARDVFDIGADEVRISAANPDTDGDGVLDSSDNCTLKANPNQLDADSDGYGNICDADLNNDGIANSLDIPLFMSLFIARDIEVDFNGDGVVNTLDIPGLVALLFKAPGPSGIVN